MTRETVRGFRLRWSLTTAVLVGLAGLSAASVQAAPDKKAPSALLPGGNSHEPININAAKLDFFDKEQKLVYSGDVVATQGDSTLKASQLIIYLTKNAQKPGGPQPGSAEETQDASAAAPGTGTSVDKMEALGPVTVIDKDQIGTGDHATYDKGNDVVTLTGNVTLSQGTNVTKGDRLVYNLNSGQAQIFSGETRGRVSSVFTPGSKGPEDLAAPAPAKKKPPAHAKGKAGGTASAAQ